MAVNKERLRDHIDACIEVAEKTNEKKVADVLRNLNGELASGEFDDDSDL